MFSTSMLHSCALLLSFLLLTSSTGWLDGTKLWIIPADWQVGRSLGSIPVEHVSVLVSGLEVKDRNPLYS